MTAPRPIVAKSRLALRLLAPADVERVYTAALERLSRVGVVPARAGAREALLAAGASPGDRRAGGPTVAAGSALTLPADLVETAAARAPGQVVLAGRVATRDVPLEPGACVLAAGGRPAPRARPLDGGRARAATLDDVRDACRLADAVPDVAVVSGPPLRAVRSDEDAARVAEIECALRATTKHLQLTAVTSSEVASVAADMADAVRGGGEPQRSPVSLVGDADAFDAGAVFARRGLPVGVVVEGATEPGSRPDLTPASLTGAVVAFVADVLAANAAIQALAPGAAFVAPVWPALAGLPTAGPDAATFVAAATQVLARAGLPAAAEAFGTDAAETDWQACTDGSFGALSAVLAGAAFASGAGTLRGDAVFSLQQLVADAEIFSWCAAIVEGIEVDDETLAVDAIKDVDVCGNFLGHRHTRRHMSDVWRPRLLDRSSWDAWVAGGRRGAADMATELAGRLLAEHEVEPLEGEPAAKLERIIAAAGL